MKRLLLSCLILRIAYLHGPEGFTIPNPEKNSELASTWWKVFSTSQPKYQETKTILHKIASVFPHNVKLYSIGSSVEGRELLVIHLGKNITQDRPLLQPQVKIVANMHGDETLGRALALMLTMDVLTNPKNADILDTIDLHIMPSMNPDGYEVVEENGECNPDSGKVGRLTANYVDLNRDFPDQFDIVETPEKDRNPETRSMMKWIRDSYFVLSVNLHALVLVASYPFDSVPPEIEHNPLYKGTGVISETPDQETFHYLADVYARNHPLMGAKNNCSDPKFHDGVVNGAEWYNVKGGMQDYNYLHSNTFEVTLELSCCKNVPSSSLLREWDNNREALRQYILSANMGIKGLVKDEQGKPIKGAMIHVKDINHEITTTLQGEYWRLILPGAYYVWAEAANYQRSPKVKVVVSSYTKAKRVDFKLKLEEKEERELSTLKNKPDSYFKVINGLF